MLSATGKEILLKAILQVIPTYTMRFFQLPHSKVQKLNKMMKKFWWGYNEDHSKIQWVSWDYMGLSKEFGGLGFRDFKSFNLAMLSKQCWRILNHQDSLSTRIFKEKYFLCVNS